MSYLILIRHGQSIANEKNIYTGWTDSPLTKLGKKQASKAGEKLCRLFRGEIKNYHTSVLSRAIMTTYIIQEQLNDLDKPVNKSWRLNERHYGALRGINKDKTRLEYGNEKVALWRRSYEEYPPLLKTPDENIGPYKLVDPRDMPLAENLQDALNRMVPYYQNEVVPELLNDNNQMIIAHGSTLRALIKYIENIPDNKIDSVEVGNAEPIIYQFDSKMNIISKEILKKD